MNHVAESILKDDECGLLDNQTLKQKSEDDIKMEAAESESDPLLEQSKEKNQNIQSKNTITTCLDRVKFNAAALIISTVAIIWLFWVFMASYKKVKEKNLALRRENDYLKKAKIINCCEADTNYFCYDFSETHFRIRKETLILMVILVSIFFLVFIMIMRKILKTSKEALNSLNSTNTKLKSETSVKEMEQKMSTGMLKKEIEHLKSINKKLTMESTSIKLDLAAKSEFIDRLQEENLSQSVSHAAYKEVLEAQLRTILRDKEKLSHKSSVVETEQIDFIEIVKQSEMSVLMTEQKSLICKLQEEVDYLKTMNTKLNFEVFAMKKVQKIEENNFRKKSNDAKVKHVENEAVEVEATNTSSSSGRNEGGDQNLDFGGHSASFDAIVSNINQYEMAPHRRLDNLFKPI